jgi:hypothetical protein
MREHRQQVQEISLLVAHLKKGLVRLQSAAGRTEVLQSAIRAQREATIFRRTELAHNRRKSASKRPPRMPTISLHSEA